MHNPDQPILKTTPHQVGFTRIYREYAPRVYRYIFARVGGHADAEDLTAQVFMEAIKGWPRLKPGDNAAAWLFTIARNKIVDRYRKNRRLVPLEGLPELISDMDDPLDQVLDAETTRRLRRVLRTLKPEHQEMLELRFAGELTFGQIAAVLGKKEPAVKMAIYRLLDQIKTQMEQDHA